jgi:hypothetical protein
VTITLRNLWCCREKRWTKQYSTLSSGSSSTSSGPHQHWNSCLCEQTM